MAFVLLTDPQKDILISHAGFQSESKWGVLNKAAYWIGQDGVAPPDGNTPVGNTRWRKSFNLAAAIGQNPTIAEDTQIVKYNLLQFKNAACVDDTVIPFDPNQVVTKLLALSQFDTAADKWFDAKISQNL